MISIIICSANANDLNLVSRNIENTVGVPHEIISFDNSDGKKGICELYNLGKKMSKFDILCFMHEDIRIDTQNWGQKVLDKFHANNQIGVVGVAGGGYKSLTPSGWYCLDYNSMDRYFQNLLQGFKLDDKDELHAYHNPYNQVLSEVVCVDGLWFCARKEILDEKPFDEELLKGFHGYDIDFCLNLYGKYKIVVTYDVLMKHASEGNFNKSWLDEMLKVHRKWSRSLPLTISDVTDLELYPTEKAALKNLVEQMLEWGYSFSQIHGMLVTVGKSNKMPLRLFFKGYVHLIEQRFGMGRKN
jgi:glycosyltransferase involved in cell wall biosynthesis